MRLGLVQRIRAPRGRKLVERLVQRRVPDREERRDRDGVGGEAGAVDGPYAAGTEHGGDDDERDDAGRVVVLDHRLLGLRGEEVDAEVRQRAEQQQRLEQPEAEQGAGGAGRGNRASRRT